MRLMCGNVSVNRTNYPQLFQQADDGIGRIDFKPANRKVQAVWMFMMVVLIKLTHHEEVDWKRVARLVARRKLAITVAMTAPVDDRAMQNSDHEVNR